MGIKFTGVSAFQWIKVGTAVETLAGTVDGLGRSLATGYNASASNRKFGIDFSCDTGKTDITGDTMVGAIRGRVVIGTSQSNASIYGMMAEMDTGTVTFTGGNYGAFYASLDLYGSNSMSGAVHCAAIFATVWNEATTTLASGVTLAGVQIIQNTAPTISSGGLNPAILIRGNTWQHGIYVAAAGVLTSNAFIKFAATIAGVAKATAENPLSDIKEVSSTGYLRIDIGSSVRYIALYSATG